MTTETIHIGGDDDWMPVTVNTAPSHDPAPNTTVGMFTDCTECNMPLIFYGMDKQGEPTYVHVGVAEDASR